MYGYADPTIAKLIQELPGAEKCSKYQMQQFLPASAKNASVKQTWMNELNKTNMNE